MTTHPGPLRSHRRRTLPLLVLTALVASGCSGVDVDTDAVLDGFAERAQTAYDEQDESRAEDFNRGVLTSCFALDPEALDAIADAVGVDEPFEDSGRAPLFGPADREQLSCGLESGEVRITVIVATTDLDVDGLVELRAEQVDGSEVVERSAEGLDDDAVVGIDNDGNPQALYLSDGLLISVGGSEDDVDEDAVFEALPVVVEQVARVLTES